MKKFVALCIKRFLPLFLFICVQFRAWAADTTTATTADNSFNIFTRPWLWIAVIVISVIAIVGPLDNGKHYRVIMKKKTIPGHKNSR